MARVPYVTKNDLPSESHGVIESHSVRPDQTSHVHQAIGHHPPLANARREFSRAVWRESGLTDRQRELIILAVAQTVGARYEWHQHVYYAITEGILSETEVRRLSDDDSVGFTDQEMAMVEYVQSFSDMNVTDSEHQQLASYFDNSEIVAITMLAMNYIGLAHIIDALNVEIEDDEFVGWYVESYSN